ncbi:MAG: toll/interleukin-1 receptor domain-containing protein [Candidatus Thiodiazotropha sp. 6PLUC2]
MADIFISYKREDREYAKKIAELLAQRGHDVWWDIELLPGDKFTDEINAILNKVKATVVLWTPDSKESPWVKSEALTAFNNNTLIPVLLKDTEIPVPFNTLHTLDLTSWGTKEVSADLGTLVNSVEQKLGSPEQVNPPISEREVDEALQRPQHELEYWESVSSSLNQSIQEYELYIEKYGQDGAFADLARKRIEALQAPEKKIHIKENLTLISVVMGILVAGFTIANYLGYFEPDEPVIKPLPKPAPSPSTISQPKPALEPEVVTDFVARQWVKSLSAVQGGSCSAFGNGWSDFAYDGKSNIRFCKQTVSSSPGTGVIDVKGIHPGNVNCSAKLGLGWEQFAYDGKANLSFCMKVGNVDQSENYVADINAFQGTNSCDGQFPGRGWDRIIYNANSGITFCAKYR